jgi:hypothetical protein
MRRLFCAPHLRLRVRQATAKAKSVLSITYNLAEPIGTGRVPHVRLSVRGPNKTGEAHDRFDRPSSQIHSVLLSHPT